MRSVLVRAVAVATVLLCTGCGIAPTRSPKDAAHPAKEQASTVAPVVATKIPQPKIVSVSAAALSPDLFDYSPSAIDFVNATAGYVLRPSSLYDGGDLLQTLDAGITWTSISLPTGYIYQGMRFFTPQDGVLFAQTAACGTVQAGCQAVVLWTQDGGVSFTPVLRESQARFWASTAWSATGGWLSLEVTCTGTCLSSSSLQQVYGTTDGGRTWTKLWSTTANTGFVRLSSNDGQSGFALLGSDLLRTTDGGRTFSPMGQLRSPQGTVTMFSGTLQMLAGTPSYASVCDGGAANGGCENYVFHSTDGGITWQSVWSRYCTDSSVVHMQSSTSGVLVLVGTTACGPGGGLAQASNIVLSTQNGFQTTKLAYAFPTGISAVQFTSTMDGWAAGSLNCVSSACSPVVYRTTDGGYQWTTLPSTQQPQRTVASLPGTGYIGIGTVLDPGAVVASATGRAWHVVGELPAQLAESFPLGAGYLQFPSPTIGYLLAYQGQGLWRTADGGKHFTELSLPGGGEGLVAASFLTPELGYVLVQSGSELLRTSDGGQTFLPVASTALSSIAFTSATTGFGILPCNAQNCGSSTPLAETTDGGKTWHTVASLPLPGFFARIAPAPGASVVVTASDGFAVLVPESGWHVVTVQPVGSANAIPGPVGGPTGIVPSTEQALVDLYGVGTLVAGYTSSTWTQP